MASPGIPSNSARWKPLVVCPHAKMSLQIKGSLHQLGITEVFLAPDYPRTGTIAAVATKQGCNLCFLDVATNQEHALLLIAEAASVVPVVALNPENDADLILRCLRRGACEFVSQASPEQIQDVLARLGRLRAPVEPANPATVYGVVPGKPGCGATTLAAHLAIDVKRAGAAGVLLVDVDCILGSIAFYLKLKPSFHLGDAVRDCLRLDTDLWSRLVTSCHGIDVLPAPENAATGVLIDRPAAMELICFWRERYERIVLDLPGVGGQGSDFLPLCDELLLVTTNELTALHAARRSIECLEQGGIGRERLKLLVTRYTPATGLKREDVEKALKVAPYALLANDYEAVQRGVLEGKPVPPASQFGRSIHTLRERLMGAGKAAKKRSWFSG